MGPDAMMLRIQAIYRRAISANTTTQSGSFPLWATCQGFHALCVLAAGNPDVVVRTHGTEFTSLPLNLTQEARASRLLGNAPPQVLQELTSNKSTLNVHSFGV